jgi:hypothetical protein
VRFSAPSSTFPYGTTQDVKMAGSVPCLKILQKSAKRDEIKHEAQPSEAEMIYRVVIYIDIFGKV